MFTNIGKILTRKPIGKYKFSLVFSLILPLIIVSGLIWGFIAFVTSETKPYLMSGYDDCAGLTQRLLVADISPSERNPTYASFFRTMPKSNNREILAQYRVENNMLVVETIPDNVPADYVGLSKDMTYHIELWEYLSTITPDELTKQFQHFVIFTDGRNNTLSSISGLLTKDVGLWLDIVDVNRSTKMTANHIHELGHLITLNQDQVENNDDDRCDNGKYCFRPDSYYIHFVNEFWDDVDASWIDANENEDEDAQRLFYNNHFDEFVTYYATTHPSEDIAETWTHFVLTKKPTAKTVAEEKILFFYEFEELVRLRDEIRTNICEYYDVPINE